MLLLIILLIVVLIITTMMITISHSNNSTNNNNNETISRERESGSAWVEGAPLFRHRLNGDLDQRVPCLFLASSSRK